MESQAARRDKRLSPRVRLRCPLRFRVIPMHGAGFRNAFAQDISRSGFRFHSMAFLPNRTSLIVEMGLLGHAPIRTLARAVWVRERPLDEGYEVGGIFVDPPHDALRTLSRLVAGA